MWTAHPFTKISIQNKCVVTANGFSRLYAKPIFLQWNFSKAETIGSVILSVLWCCPLYTVSVLERSHCLHISHHNISTTFFQIKIKWNTIKITSTGVDVEVRHSNTGESVFFIKGSNAFNKNSIGNFAVSLDPRIWKEHTCFELEVGFLLKNKKEEKRLFETTFAGRNFRG